jgi:hypothetical protein
MMGNPRVEPRFGGSASQMVIATPPTKGMLLARVDGLIAAIGGSVGDGAARTGNSRWRRLTEERAPTFLW